MRYLHGQCLSGLIHDDQVEEVRRERLNRTVFDALILASAWNIAKSSRRSEQLPRIQSCNGRPKAPKIASFGWSTRMFRSARYRVRGRLYSPIRFHRELHNFQRNGKATAVLQVPGAIVINRRR